MSYKIKKETMRDVRMKTENFIASHWEEDDGIYVSSNSKGGSLLFNPDHLDELIFILQALRQEIDEEVE